MKVSEYAAGLHEPCYHGKAKALAKAQEFFHGAMEALPPRTVRIQCPAWAPQVPGYCIEVPHTINPRRHLSEPAVWNTAHFYWHQ